jgi:hypothetical protein
VHYDTLALRNLNTGSEGNVLPCPPGPLYLTGTCTDAQMHTFLNANELKATAKPTSHDNSSTITILYTGICIAHLVLFTLFIVLVVYIFKTDEIYACAQGG